MERENYKDLVSGFFLGQRLKNRFGSREPTEKEEAPQAMSADFQLGIALGMASKGRPYRARGGAVYERCSLWEWGPWGTSHDLEFSDEPAYRQYLVDTADSAPGEDFPSLFIPEGFYVDNSLPGYYALDYRSRYSTSVTNTGNGGWSSVSVLNVNTLGTVNERSTGATLRTLPIQFPYPGSYRVNFRDIGWLTATNWIYTNSRTINILGNPGGNEVVIDSVYYDNATAGTRVKTNFDVYADRMELFFSPVLGMMTWNYYQSDYVHDAGEITNTTGRFDISCNTLYHSVFRARAASIKGNRIGKWALAGGDDTPIGIPIISENGYAKKYTGIYVYGDAVTITSYSDGGMMYYDPRFKSEMPLKSLVYYYRRSGSFAFPAYEGVNTLDEAVTINFSGGNFTISIGTGSDRYYSSAYYLK